VSQALWRWVAVEAVYAIHDEQLAEHSGLSGLRDEGLLLSALARPQHLVAYGAPGVADLAASYAIGIARNHPFVDGNKRTALVVSAGLFLPLNGYEVVADNTALIRVMLAVADGSMSEEELAAWFRTYMRRLSGKRSAQ
jgi:death-on-curing protein